MVNFLAGLEGFEPPTPGFGIRCSSQLELQTFLSISSVPYVVYATCKIYRISSIPDAQSVLVSCSFYNSYCYTLYMLKLYSSPLHLTYLCKISYSIILVTTPAPTVFPPSLIANRNPSSIAIGVINSILKFALSPGITISAPPSNVATPVTSVVRK